MTKKIKVIKNSDKLSAAFSAYNSLLNIEYEIIIKNGGCIESFAEKKFSAYTIKIPQKLRLKYSKNYD